VLWFSKGMFLRRNLKEGASPEGGEKDGKDEGEKGRTYLGDRQYSLVRFPGRGVQVCWRVGGDGGSRADARKKEGSVFFHKGELKQASGRLQGTGRSKLLVTSPNSHQGRVW